MELAKIFFSFVMAIIATGMFVKFLKENGGDGDA